MLKLKTTTESSDENLALSGYTVSATWEDFHDQNLIYWRTGNFKNNLIEIGFGDKTHAIRKIKIVMVSRLWLTKDNETDVSNSALVPKKGLPICEWTWDKPSPHTVDEVLDFHVHIAQSGLMIRFGDEVDIAKIIQAGRVQFGLDHDDYMRRIWITELQPSELSKIRMTFPSS